MRRKKAPNEGFHVHARLVVFDALVNTVIFVLNVGAQAQDDQRHDKEPGADACY